MSSHRIVITGARGYLGKHLVSAARATGAAVTAIDISPCPDTDDSDVLHLRHDVRDREAMSAALAGADAIVHAAFAPPAAARDQMFDVNVNGADVVCAAAIEAGVKRVVVLSSTIVDRRIRPHPILKEAPVSGLARYAETRRAAEQVVNGYADRGLSTAIVRPKTFVGPGRVGGFSLVFDLVRRGDVVPLAGPGRSRYQLVDVRDLARGVIMLADDHVEGVVTFGARRFGSVSEDLTLLIEHAGTGSRLRSIPGSVGRVALRSVELANLTPLGEWHHCVAAETDSVVDIARATNELGWEPIRSNVDALTDAFDWYVDESSRSDQRLTTHPVPLTHRALRKAIGVVLR
jgi:nucleoside-diphosphate-sugar epimerase